MEKLTKDQVRSLLQNAPEGTSPAGIISALRQKGYELEGYQEAQSVAPKTNILKEFGKELIRTPMGLLASAKNAVKNIGSAAGAISRGEKTATDYSEEKLFGFDPLFSGKENTGQMLTKASGAAAEIGSYALPGAKGLSLTKRVGLNAAGGFIEGAGTEMARTGEIDADTAKAGAFSAVANVVGGEVINTLVKGGSKIVAKVNESLGNTPEILKQNALARWKKGFEATTKANKKRLDKLDPSILDEGYWGTRKAILEKAEANIKLGNDEYEKLGDLAGNLTQKNVERLTKTINKQKASYLLPNGKVNSAYKGKYNKLKAIEADILALKNADGEIGLEDLKGLRQAYDSITFGLDAEAKEAKTIYTQFANQIRGLLGDEVPAYKAINEFYKKANIVQKVMSDTIERTQNKASFSLFDGLFSMGGSLAGLATGNISDSVLYGMGLLGASKFLRSTMWRTSSAVAQKKFADTLQKLSPRAIANFLLLPDAEQANIFNNFQIGKTAKTFDTTKAFQGIVGTDRNVLPAASVIKIPKTFGSKEISNLAEYSEAYMAKNGSFPKLKEILKNPKLFQAYQQLGELEILPMKTIQAPGGTVEGFMDFNTNRIMIGNKTGTEAIKEVLPHEIQHAIQVLEGELNARTMLQFKNNPDAQRKALEELLSNPAKLKESGISIGDMERLTQMNEYLKTNKVLNSADAKFVRDISPEAAKIAEDIKIKKDRFEQEAHTVSETLDNYRHDVPEITDMPTFKRSNEGAMIIEDYEHEAYQNAIPLFKKLRSPSKVSSKTAEEFESTLTDILTEGESTGGDWDNIKEFVDLFGEKNIKKIADVGYKNEQVFFEVMDNIRAADPQEWDAKQIANIIDETLKTTKVQGIGNAIDNAGERKDLLLNTAVRAENIPDITDTKGLVTPSIAGSRTSNNAIRENFGYGDATLVYGPKEMKLIEKAQKSFDKLTPDDITELKKIYGTEDLNEIRMQNLKMEHYAGDSWTGTSRIVPDTKIREDVLEDIAKEYDAPKEITERAKKYLGLESYNAAQSRLRDSYHKEVDSVIDELDNIIANGISNGKLDRSFGEDFAKAKLTENLGLIKQALYDVKYHLSYTSKELPGFTKKYENYVKSFKDYQAESNLISRYYDKIQRKADVPKSINEYVKAITVNNQEVADKAIGELGDVLEKYDVKVKAKNLTDRDIYSLVEDIREQVKSGELPQEAFDESYAILKTMVDDSSTKGLADPGWTFLRAWFHDEVPKIEDFYKSRLKVSENHDLMRQSQEDFLTAIEKTSMDVMRETNFDIPLKVMIMRNAEASKGNSKRFTDLLTDDLEGNALAKLAPEKAREFAESIAKEIDSKKKQLLAKYIETKHIGLLPTGAIKVAVVPEFTSNSVIKSLEDKGITVKKYDGTTKGRINALQKLPPQLLLSTAVILLGSQNLKSKE